MGKGATPRSYSGGSGRRPEELVLGLAVLLLVVVLLMENLLYIKKPQRVLILVDIKYNN